MNLLTEINEATQKTAETIGTVLACITLIIILLGAITFCIWAIMCYVKTTEKRKEYIDTLDDHDKAVIMTYKSIDENAWKKEKK